MKPHLLDIELHRDARGGLVALQPSVNSAVNAGPVVTKDTPDHCLAAGNDAGIFKCGIPGKAGPL